MTGPTKNYSPLNEDRSAAPGEVQAAIDAANAAGGGRVVLRPESTYDPSSTWVVKDGVTLDYNGAVVELSTDIDILDMRSGGKAIQPRHDVRGVTNYSGKSIKFVAQSGSEGNALPYDTWVRGGYTYQTFDETTGTGVYWEDTDPDASGASGWAFAPVINHRIEGPGTGVHRRADGATAYVNSCTFSGVIHNAVTCILDETLNGGEVARTETNVKLQPNASVTDIGWRLNGANVSDNIVTGAFWDNGNYGTNLIVIDDAGTNNCARGTNGAAGYQNVTDNSGDSWFWFGEMGNRVDGTCYSYLGSNQTLPAGGSVTVNLDTVVDQNPLDKFDTATGTYSLDESMTFKATAMFHVTGLSAGDVIQADIGGLMTSSAVADASGVARGQVMFNRPLGTTTLDMTITDTGSTGGTIQSGPNSTVVVWDPMSTA